MYFQFLGLDFSHYILWFFIYSFLGWIMECIVIRKQLGYWENRGFVKAPFCMIYGLGCTLALMMFHPIRKNLIALYIWGAIAATALEFITAKIMMKLFGEIWWDYSHLKYNYKGIICLESTLGWGCLSIFIVGFFNDVLVRMVSTIPNRIAVVFSTALFLEYVIDFGYHFYKSLTGKEHIAEEEEEPTYKEN